MGCGGAGAIKLADEEQDWNGVRIRVVFLVGGPGSGKDTQIEMIEREVNKN